MKNSSLGTLTTIILICIAGTWRTINGKRILIITPVPSYSHHTSYEPIWLALNERGHDITILTAYPGRHKNLTNYREIDFSCAIEMVKDLNIVEHRDLRFLEMLQTFQEVILQLSEYLFDNAELRQLYTSEARSQFDLVIVELFFVPAASLVASKFDAPTIGIMSGYISNDLRYTFGSPILSSHPSNWELRLNRESHFTFWRRIQNFVVTWTGIYLTMTDYSVRQQMIAEKYLGKDLPDGRETIKNLSLILMNQNSAFMYARPELPNLIAYTNLHVSRPDKPLPKNLKNFLDNATEGFIYMSLGSNVKSRHLPKDILQVFIDVFSMLPYKVLWKFETDELIGKPANVFISKWIPQQQVLAHPNIKLYIYQGGYQSTEEAVHNAVPLLGIPFFSDQYYNIYKMVSLGVAEHMSLSAVTREILSDTITRIVNNSSYKERMEELRALSKDLPTDSLENVLWWIEFVMHHRGAPHLRYSVADEPWYQRYDVDVIAFLAIVLFLIGCALLAMLVQLSIFISKCFYANEKRKEKHE